MRKFEAAIIAYQYTTLTVGRPSATVSNTQMLRPIVYILRQPTCLDESVFHFIARLEKK